MIAEHIKIVDIDGRHWRNLTRIRRHGLEKTPSKKSTLVAMHDGARVLKAVHSERGTLFGFQADNPRNARALAEKAGVDVAWSVERGALQRALFAGALSVRYDMDFIEQLMLLFSGFRGEPGIVRHPPRRPMSMSYRSLQTPFRWGFPNGCTALFYVFDAPDRVWTSVIVRKQRGHIDLLTTHDTLVADGFQLRDWREQFIEIREAVARKWGRPFVGVFLDAGALAEINRAKNLSPAVRAAWDRGAMIVNPFPLRIRWGLRVLRKLGRV